MWPRFLPFLCLVGLGVSRIAAAQAAGGSYAWSSPPASIQLAQDQTVIPAGQGAVFVPRISGAPEPGILIVDGDKVRPAPVGIRVILPPGRYVILVGSGAPDLSAGVPVEVRAGQTTLVPTRWGALRVEVVDDGLVRHDGAFQIVHADTGRVIERPPQDSEGAKTWLLEPGLYRITPPGYDRLTGSSFVTVHVPEGGLANLRLFMDRRTGQIEGGGVVPLNLTLPDATEDQSDWIATLVVGVQGNATQTAHLPGMPDATLASGSAFLDGRLEYRGDYQGLVLTGRAEEGQQYIEVIDGRALPLLKTRDRLEGQVVYSLQVNPGLGIYGRAGGSTQLFDTRAVASEDVQVALRAPDGSVEYRSISGGETWQIADAMSPTLFRLGAGLQSRFFNWRALSLSVRAGPGMRINRYEGALVSEDNPDTPALEYTRLGSFDQQGVEGTATLNARINNAVSLNSTAETFFVFGDWDTPIVELGGSLNVRLSSVFSLNYTANAAFNPYVTSELSLRQGGVLRASWSLL